MNNASFDIVQLFVEKGHNVDERDSDGRTPFMNYIRPSRDPGLFEFFIEKGANVNARDHEGKSVLAHAITYINWEALKVILQSPKLVQDKRFWTGRDLLTLVFENWVQNPMFFQQPEIVDVVEKMLNLGYDADAGTSMPLILAILARETELVKLLLDHGADPNVLPGTGVISRSLYPLEVAAEILPPERAISIIDPLLAAGTNPYLTTRRGKTMAERFKNKQVRDHIIARSNMLVIQSGRVPGNPLFTLHRLPTDIIKLVGETLLGKSYNGLVWAIQYSEWDIVRAQLRDVAGPLPGLLEIAIANHAPQDVIDLLRGG